MKYSPWSNRRRGVVADAARGAPAGAHLASNLPVTKPPPRKPIPPPTTLEEVCSALRRQQLVELRLGWREELRHNDYEHQSIEESGDPNWSTEEDGMVGGCQYLRNKRQIRQLVKAIQYNKSLKRLSLGWWIPNRYWIVQILDAFQSNNAITLEGFQLILHHNIHWLPEDCLKKFLSNQTNLVSIDLQGVRAVLPKLAPSGSYCGCCQYYSRRVVSTTTSPQQPCGRDHCVVSRVIVHLHHHDRLKALQLSDCSITDKEANLLADYLHIRGGIARLSLRKNTSRYLSLVGLRDICQAPIMELLDLSLCDLGTMEAKMVATSIAKRPWPLHELSLCANYRIDTSGLVALTSKECCEKVVGLNISFCDIGAAKAVRILESLERNLSSTTALQRISMQGCRLLWSNPSQATNVPQVRSNRPDYASSTQSLDKDDDNVGILSNALSRLLEQNNSLRVVRLNDPCRPTQSNSYLSTSDLSRLVRALQHNYELEVLQMDNTTITGNTTNAHRLLHSNISTDDGTTTESASANNLRANMDFVMRLNQAGRRILLSRDRTKLRRQQQQQYDNGLYERWNGRYGTTNCTSWSDMTRAMTLRSNHPMRHAAPPMSSMTEAFPRTDTDDNDEWLYVLAKAGAAPDLDVLFWMVRECAGRFGKLRKKDDTTQQHFLNNSHGRYLATD